MSSVPVDAHWIVRVNMIDLTDAESGYHQHHHRHHRQHHSHKNLSYEDELGSKRRPYCKPRALHSDRSKFPSSCSKTHSKDSKQVGLNERRVQHRSFLHPGTALKNFRRFTAKAGQHKPLAAIMRLKHCNSMIVLLLLLSTLSALSLNCCIEALESKEGGKGEQVVKIHRMSSVEQLRTNSSSLSLNLLDDENDGQSAPTGTTELPSSSANIDEPNDNDESDNSTQIPFENEYIPNDNNNYNNNNNNNRQTTTRKPYQGNAASMGTTIQPAPAIKQRSSNNNLRITEIDLLPFSEFTVQQPAFSDLMRSWPPTTLQTTIAAADQANKRMLARQQLRGSQQQQSFEQSGAQMAPGNGRPNRVVPIRHQQHHSLQQQQRQFELDHAQLESFASVLQRNHLNEDFDDTIVTADQSFESDELLEPPTWINYLGEWGDFIYVQLQQYLDKPSPSNGSQRRPGNNNGEPANETASSSLQPLKIESIDELLDDYYYDQYENSQVLYYGPQLVREGDIFEIGCFMPNDQPAEWSKSGKPLLADKIQPGSPRVIRRSDFLGAKQNFSLKVFEASLSDSGNYRCNKMSRKYHKLVVVPLKATTAQIYHIQQRLLSVVNPALMSSQASLGPSGIFQANSATSPPKPSGGYTQRPASSSGRAASKFSQSRHHLVPGYLIMENRPLVVNCHITDEQVLHLLRESPQFRLKWYKNGKQLRGSYALPNSNSNHLLSSQSNNNLATSSARRTDQARARSSQQTSMGSSSGSSASFTSALGVISPQSRPNAPLGNNQRIQFLQANGRQLYISGAQYSDAGDYSCLWSGLGQVSGIRKNEALFS